MMNGHLAVTILLGFAACSDTYDTAPAKEPGPKVPMTPMSGKKPLAMRNCPSAVPGAITRVRPTADGVELTITADNPQARHEIGERAGRHAAFQLRHGLAPEHSGLHGGPESIGYCPIVHTNTIIATTPLPEGVRIVITARSPDDAKAIQRTIEERVRALARPSS